MTKQVENAIQNLCDINTIEMMADIYIKEFTLGLITYDECEKHINNIIEYLENM